MPDVGIRPPKCFDYMGIWYKTEGFKDADCHVATLLAMTFRNLMPFS